jgi:arylsulfatase A
MPAGSYSLIFIRAIREIRGQKQHSRPVAIFDWRKYDVKPTPHPTPQAVTHMLRTLILAPIALISLVGIALAADADKPNIILIMADDLGYETIGANGGESYKTPNLDRLAATGVRFERCQVQPLCTPTRVQLMTGMSNARNYIEFGRMDPTATTFANLLKDAGYATAIAGKWQLGRDKELPERFGFDESCLWQHTRRPPRYANPGLEYNGQQRDFKNGEYGPDLVNDFALKFIEKNRAKPFLLYYPMMLPHAPYQPTPDSRDWDPKAKSQEANKSPKYFADDVAYMDKLVGKIVAKVDELGIRDNTLILFLGDNGTGKGITSKFKGAAYAGGKGLTTARGMHVPLIANWPGHTPAGRVNDDLIDSTDFLPTLCAAAGVPVPSSLPIDGHSFLPQLQGEKGEPRQWIYTWYARDGVPPVREFVANKDYKLYRNGRFYDLRKDPFEEQPPQQVTDLKGNEAEIAKQLKAVFAKFEAARPAEIQKTATDGAPKNRERRAARNARRLAKEKATDNE